MSRRLRSVPSRRSGRRACRAARALRARIEGWPSSATSSGQALDTRPAPPLGMRGKERGRTFGTMCESSGPPSGLAGARFSLTAASAARPTLPERRVMSCFVMRRTEPPLGYVMQCHDLNAHGAYPAVLSGMTPSPRAQFPGIASGFPGFASLAWMLPFDPSAFCSSHHPACPRWRDPNSRIPCARARARLCAFRAGAVRSPDCAREAGAGHTSPVG